MALVIELLDGWMVGCGWRMEYKGWDMTGWVSEWVSEWVVRWMGHGWMDGGVGGWIVWMGGLVDGGYLTVGECVRIIKVIKNK